MKIAIGRLGHIGDIIACEPVSRYLRHKYPDAHLSWVVETAYRELIDTNPHIDETVTLECTTDWIKLTKHGAYDEIVDLHANYRACKHCRVPLVKAHGNPFVSIHDHHDYGTLLEAFSIGAGLPKLSAAPRVHLRPQHAAAVDALGLPAAYCVIHRQSTSPRKDWSAADWRTVVGWIARELRLPVVEVGASGAGGPAPLPGVAIDLVDRTSILETAEVIRRARFFVGVDSAPAHLANAVRTPGVVLLGWLGVFRSYMPFNGHFAGGGADVQLVRNLAGPVRDIPVRDVVEAIRRVADAVPTRSAQMAPRPAPGAAVTEAHRRLVRASGLFDASWYVVHHPEAAAAGIDALDHFLSVGGALGASPGPDFDLPWYVAQHGDVARSGLNPLLHFLEHGRAEGRPSRPEAVVPDGRSGRLSADGADEEDAAVPRPAEPAGGMPRLLAFQTLPRHAIREQVRLAAEHGISGFVLPFHRAEGGTRRPDAIAALAGSEIPAPFCLLYQDANVARRSPADELALIRDLVPLFSDARYAKVDGKPLLLVEATGTAPQASSATRVWRDEIGSHGFPGLHLVMAADGRLDAPHPRLLGFDAAYEIPVKAIPGQAAADYGDLARFHMGQPFPEHKRFRTVMLPPDVDAAGAGAGAAEAFKLWLTQVVLDTRARYAPAERLVFLQPWSEASAGGLGRDDLAAIRDALADARAAIALDETGPDGATVALLRRIAQEKDEGAFRVLQATRMQAAAIQRELRAQLAAERRALAQLRASTAWRVTASLRGASQGVRAAFRRLRGR